MTNEKMASSSSSSTFQAAEALMSLQGAVVSDEGQDFLMDEDSVEGEDQSSSPFSRCYSENMDCDQEVPQSNNMEDDGNIIVEVSHSQECSTEAEETFDKEWKSYEYSVPWSTINLSILKNLDSAERQNREANMKDVVALKQWLMTDLYNSYEAFKNNYYVKTKTPGVRIYKSVSSQVVDKFKCIKNMSKKTGYVIFLQSFTIAMENMGRRAKEVENKLPLLRPSRRAVQSKGTPGVIGEEHHPELTEDMQHIQENQQCTLQTMSRTTRAKSLNYQSITKLMHQTYELQRRDIVAALKKIEEKNKSQDDPDDEIENEISKLKSTWPFLFDLRWQSLHFLRHCGQNLEIPMQDYCQVHLRILLQFLANNTTDSGLKNVAELWKWDDADKNPKVQLLVAIQMLANYFNERTESLIKTAERTSPAYDLLSCVPDLTGGLTIVALDTNKFTAEKFYVCLDREVVLTTDNSTDAVLGLMQTAFIFDAHYPRELKFTFEFLERVICRLGGEHTRRNAPVLTMSASVTRLVNAVDKFATKLSQHYK